MLPLPTVSVIIPAFNEEKFIGKTLDGVRNQDYPKDRIEISVVDNGSTDRTQEICREFGVPVIDAPGLRVGALRNRGAEKAAGEVLAFLDADCVPASDWLSSAVKSLGQEPCVTGAQYMVPQDAWWGERIWFAQPKQGRSVALHINAGNLIVRRDLFQNLGGFDVNMASGEDAEFCLRASAEVRVITDSSIRVVHYGNPKNLKGILLREIWHGMGALEIGKRYKLDRSLLGTILFGVLSIGGAVAVGLSPWWGWYPLAGIAVALSGLLVATTLYKTRGRWPASDFFRLAVLYVIYYLGRSIALGMLLTGNIVTHRKK